MVSFFSLCLGTIYIIANFAQECRRQFEDQLCSFKPSIRDSNNTRQNSRATTVKDGSVRWGARYSQRFFEGFGDTWTDNIKSGKLPTSQPHSITGLRKFFPLLVTHVAGRISRNSIRLRPNCNCNCPLWWKPPYHPSSPFLSFSF